VELEKNQSCFGQAMVHWSCEQLATSYYVDQVKLYTYICTCK
jgi:hypothetical protein